MITLELRIPARACWVLGTFMKYEMLLQSHTYNPAVGRCLQTTNYPARLELKFNFRYSDHSGGRIVPRRTSRSAVRPTRTRLAILTLALSLPQVERQKDH